MTLASKFIVAIVGVTSANAIEDYKECTSSDRACYPYCDCEISVCIRNETLVWDPTTNSFTPAELCAPSLVSRLALFALISTCSIKVYDVYSFYFNDLPAVQTDDTCSFYDFLSGFCCCANRRHRPTDKDSTLAEPLAAEPKQDLVVEGGDEHYT
jgi:hypothetical protein